VTRIRTPDQRLRVFVSSTLGELAEERAAVRRAVTRLRLAPVMFEAGARPHPPRELYRAYLAQSHVFVGIYWQRYGWVAPGEDVSGLEDEYALSGDRPKLMYVKAPAPDREPRLTDLLERVKADDRASYRPFRTAEELEELVADDLAVLLTERFENALLPAATPAPEEHRPHATRGLPAPFTTMVGREREVEDVVGLLARPGVRLVTLTGPGGVGKSRVAIAAAERATALFPDGVTFVGLGGVRDAGLVVGAIAAALAIREAPDRTPLEAVIDHLRERRELLVLDNCEHVLAAGPRVSELLAACPGLRVLATSRAVLRLRGEHDVEVEPLPEDEAVRLFVERAEQVNPDFDASARAAVAEVCRRLDGLPLAIELAAARTRMLTPAALLARLTSRLALLTGGPRDLPERQQTLRAALDWDYDLLDGEERALFRRLAVCDGGAGFDAVEALAAAGGGLGVDPADAVESLVAKSLLHRDAASPEPRFAMLQTVREYALERLAESGERELAERAHADHFAGVVREVADGLIGPDSRRLMLRIDADRANIRAATAYASRSGDVGLEVALCARLAPYWLARAAFAEATQAVETAVAHSAGITVPDRVRVLVASAMLARARGDFETAHARIEAATAEAEATGNLPGLARAHRERGAIAYDEGDVAAAAAATERAYDAAVEVGDDDLVARSLNNLAVFAFVRGEHEKARDLYARSLRPFARTGDRLGIARALMNLGRLHLTTGDADRARVLSERALAMWWALGDEWDATDSLDDVALLRLESGDAVAAAEVFAAAAAMRDRLGARLPLSELGEYERRDARIAAALTVEENAAARARGAALDFAGAVRLALGEIPANTVLDVGDVDELAGSVG
jgi:predicted ATPase